MRSSLLISLMGAATLAAAALVGCGDSDAKPVSSNLGDSCVRTADCASGLSCISNVCYKVAPSKGDSAGASSMPVPPVLGGEGESCTSRLDCADGLGCFNNRCTVANDVGEGGAPGLPVNLGDRGESCRVNGDCSAGLVCVPSSLVAGTGVCDTANFGLEATGMACTGECLEAADCCQLPIALHTTSINSCEDIADEIKTEMIDCSAPASPLEKTLCFEQATYCKCTAKTWACDADTHACVYTAPCVADADRDVPTGCPSFSRLHSLSALTCNATAKKCVGPSATPGCTSDAKCVGQQVFDSVATDLCTTGECTCYAGNKQCYRKCARDIDCGAGMVCDTKKTELCVPSGACDNDTQCAVRNENITFKCKADTHTCAQTCASDRDCSPTGAGGQGKFEGLVCGADHYCASVVSSCTPDTQCPATPGGLKPFCVPVADAGAEGGVSSAVTD